MEQCSATWAATDLMAVALQRKKGAREEGVGKQERDEVSEAYEQVSTPCRA